MQATHWEVPAQRSTAARREAHQRAGSIGEAEVAIIDEAVLMLCAPLVGSAFSGTELEGRAPVAAVLGIMYPKLLLRQ